MPEKELLFLKLFTSTCFFCLFSLSEQELCVKVLPDNKHFKKLFICTHFPAVGYGKETVVLEKTLGRQEGPSSPS